MKSNIDTKVQFSSEKIIPKGNPLDTLCATLEKKMQFEEGERGKYIYAQSYLPKP
jgi:saccharopine dehydrogenase (NADP+, L-glutamate forming)